MPQFNLGLLYRKGDGVTQDMPEAASWFLKAAEQGNQFAQDSLGKLYESGTGVTKDREQAVSWYQKAIAQGNADAKYNLGLMQPKDK